MSYAGRTVKRNVDGVHMHAWNCGSLWSVGFPEGPQELITEDAFRDNYSIILTSDELFCGCVQLGADRAAVAGWPDHKRQSYIEGGYRDGGMYGVSSYP